MTTELKVGTKVARKSDGEVLGTITRFLKNGHALIKNGIDAEPVEVKVTHLIGIKIGQPANASAPASEKDKPTRDVTTDVQLKLTGTVRGPNWEVISRRFKTVEGAAEYLEQFKLKDIDGRNAKLEKPAEASLFTNYAIEDILARRAPKGGLPVILFDDPNKRNIVMPSSATIPDSVTPPATAAKGVERGVAMNRAPDVARAAATQKAASGTKLTGQLVVLKQICQDLNIEPREARMKLRSGIKKKAVPEGDAGRWAWKAEDVEAVKAFLNGDEAPKAAKAPAPKVKGEPPHEKIAKAVKAKEKEAPPVKLTTRKAFEAKQAEKAAAKGKKQSLKERMQARKAAKKK